MLVHIKLLSEFIETSTSCEYDYEKTTTIGYTNVEDYDRYVEFVQKLINHKKPLIIGENWYNVEDYGFNFPENSTCMPCLYIYVSEYC